MKNDDTRRFVARYLCDKGTVPTYSLGEERGKEGGRMSVLRDRKSLVREEGNEHDACYHSMAMDGRAADGVRPCP